MSARAERRRAEKAAKKEARRKGPPIPRVSADGERLVLARDPDVYEALIRAQMALMPPEEAAEYRRLNDGYVEGQDDPEGDARASELDERYRPTEAQIRAALTEIKAERAADME